MKPSIALLVAALTACNTAESRWTGTIRDSSGVSIVENGNEALWRPGEQWRVEPFLTIGTSGDDVNYQFGRIVSVAVDAEQNVYALDFQAGQVRVFDSAGTFVRAIGRKGRGPGEIAAPVWMYLGTDGSVIVADRGNTRLSRFLPDGTEEGSYPMRIDQRGFPIRWESLRNGGAVAQWRRFGGRVVGEPPPVEPVVAVDINGGLSDTLTVVPRGNPGPFNDAGVSLQYFVPEPWWSVSSNRQFHVGISDRYRIERHDWSGQLLSIVSKPFQPRPVEDIDRRIATRAITAALMARFNLTVATPAVERLVGRLEFGETFPAYAGFRVGYQGSLWVQHYPIPSDLTDDERHSFDPAIGFTSRSWDVYERSGRFLGTVEMPARFRPILFRDDRIYGVWRDGFDVEYVMGAAVLSGDDSS